MSTPIQTNVKTFQASKILTVQTSKSQQSEKVIFAVLPKKVEPHTQSTNKLSSSINPLDTIKVLNEKQQNPLTKINQQNLGNKMMKSSSQPRFRSIKEEILKIPKVKQILQKDKLVYISDIQKRLQLIGDVKNQNYQQKQLTNLIALRKPMSQGKKKNRRHKTNYKIPLTKKNINCLNTIITDHISHNQKFKNQQFIFLSPSDYIQPFNLKKLKFMDQINPLKRKYKQKFPQLKQGVLSKNKLLLEHVILSRNIKREMNIDKKKQQKQHKQMLTQLDANRKSQTQYAKQI